jgi:arylsulfatase A-like enzyme
VHGSHGEALDEHGVTGHGVELYEEVIWVPLVIALPGAKGGLRYPRPVSTVDIAPTVLDLAQAAKPAESAAPSGAGAGDGGDRGGGGSGVDGESLAAILAGNLDVKRGPVFARGPRRGAVIDWPLKLVVIERKKRNRYHLFDLDTDPDEARDQSDVRHEDLERMVAIWEKLEVAAGSAPEPSN